jgi:hypothetical protein
MSIESAGVIQLQHTPVGLSNRPLIQNLAPVALALTLGYALAIGLFMQGTSFRLHPRGVEILLAGVAFGMAMWRSPVRVVCLIRRPLEHLSWPSIAIVAIGLRVCWILVSGVTQTSDFANYDRMARDICEGRYIVHPFKSSGPSILFALHYLVLGHRPLAPQLTLAVLSSVQVLLVYSLLVKTTSSERAALLGATILAVWPEHILYVNLLGSDVLFSTLVLLATWLLSQAWGSRLLRHLAAAFAAGIALGLSHWVRTTAFAYLLPGVLFLALEESRPLRRRSMALGALGAGFLVPILPLMYLNYRMTGFPSPMSSQAGGWSLLVGSNPASLGRYNKEDETLVNRLVATQTPRPGEHRFVFRDRIAKEIALKRIREQPGVYAWTMLRYKVSLLWAEAADISWSVRESRFGAYERRIRKEANFFHGLAVAAAVVGLTWTAVRRRCAWDVRQVLFWAALLTTIIHCFVEVQPRYHHMFLPTLAIAIGQIMTAGGEPAVT